MLCHYNKGFMDKDLDLAGISTHRHYDRIENEQYAYIQEHMLYELTVYIISNNIKEFKIAMVQFLLNDDILYREAAEDLLNTQFEMYKVDIEKLLLLY